MAGILQSTLKWPWKGTHECVGLGCSELVVCDPTKNAYCDKCVQKFQKVRDSCAKEANSAHAERRLGPGDDSAADANGDSQTPPMSATDQRRMQLVVDHLERSAFGQIFRENQYARYSK